MKNIDKIVIQTLMDNDKRIYDNFISIKNKTNDITTAEYLEEKLKDAPEDIQEIANKAVDIAKQEIAWEVHRRISRGDSINQLDNFCNRYL